MLAWKRGDLAGVTGRLLAAFAVTAAAGAALDRACTTSGPSLAAGGIALGVWVIAGSLNELALRMGVGLPLDPARVCAVGRAACRARPGR